MHSSTSSSSGSFGFLLRVAGAAMAILLAYNLLLWVVQPQVTPSTDAGMRNGVVAERYFDGGVANAVITGTSLAFRLSPDFLQADELGAGIYDLALGGGSAATGLEIIRRKGDVPRVVFVETNFAYLPIDPTLLRELVSEPRRTLRRHLPAFRLENRPVDLLIASSWAGLRKALVGQPVARPLAGEATDEPEIANLASRLALTLSQNATVPESLPTEIKSGLRATGALIEDLRKRDTRIVLLRFPMHPAVEATPMQQYLRRQVEAQFPRERHQWFDVPNDGSYRTDDGLHLTRPSARRLAAVLRGFVEAQAPR